MNVTIHLHGYADRPSVATVDAWWADGRGMHHAYLLDRQPLDVPEGAEHLPMELLRALFEHLGGRL